MRISALLIVLTLISSAIFASGQAAYPKPQIGSATGQLAPDFTLKDQNGKPFELSQQRGHWVLLFFYRGYW